MYLSMIRDLYDNSIAACKAAAQQMVNLVLDAIRSAMKKEKKRAAAELQFHSDQGFQYTSQAYVKLTQSYGMPPSMSASFCTRRRNSSLCEKWALRNRSISSSATV